MNPIPVGQPDRVQPQAPLPPAQPPKTQPVVWHKSPHAPHLPAALDPSNAQLTLFSFKKPMEDAFECLKSLEFNIETVLSPEGVGLKAVDNQIKEARDRLKILSHEVNNNPTFKKAYGKSIRTMWQRLDKCETVFAPIRIDALKMEISTALHAIADEVPAEFPEGYADLMRLEREIDDKALEYAQAHVNANAPSALLGAQGKKLVALTQARDLIRDYKSLLVEKQIKECSRSTRHLITEIEHLAGHITSDQKWAIATLSELNIPFEAEEPVRYQEAGRAPPQGRHKYEFRKYQTTTREILYKMLNLAKTEKNSNQKEIAKDQYSHLSGNVGRAITPLNAKIFEIVDESISQLIFEHLAALSNLLMARVGSTFNSQPVTDSIPLMLGSPRPGVADRYLSREKHYAEEIYAYPSEEQALIKEGYLGWDEYGFWLRNDYVRAIDDKLITWQGKFQFERGDTTMSEATAFETLDLSRAGFIKREHLHHFVDFLHDVSSKSDPREVIDFQIEIETIGKIPNELKPLLHDDPVFWQKLLINELSQDQKQFLPEILRRYNIVKEIAFNYVLSLNMQLRKIFYESAGQTAPEFDPRSISLTDKIGFAVRWVFATLSDSLRDFILAPDVKIEAVKEPPRQEVDFKKLLPNHFHLKLQGAPQAVVNLFTTYGPIVKGMDQKEKVFDFLLKVHQELGEEKWANLPLNELVKFRENVEHELARSQDRMDGWEYELVRPPLQKLVNSGLAEIDARIARFS